MQGTGRAVQVTDLSADSVICLLVSGMVVFSCLITLILWARTRLQVARSESVLISGQCTPTYPPTCSCQQPLIFFSSL